MKELIKLQNERIAAVQELKDLQEKAPRYPGVAVFKTWNDEQLQQFRKKQEAFKLLENKAKDKIETLEAAEKIRKQILEKKLQYITDQCVIKLNYNGLMLDKRKLKKIIALLNESDILKGFEIYAHQENSALKISIYHGNYNKLLEAYIYIFTYSKACNDFSKYDFKVVNYDDIMIKTNNEYKKLAKQALKKQKQLNNKLIALKKEAEAYCDEFKENTGAYISSYLKDNNYNFFKD